MKLANLLENVEIKKIDNKVLDYEIKDIKIDHNQVESGDVFIAMKGSEFDGNNFVTQALKNGAQIVISEKEFDYDNVITVKDARKAYTLISKNFFEKACDDLKFIGVTGTNGKTTTTNIISNILKESGESVATIGTLGVIYDHKNIDTGMTTPDPYQLHKLFLDMRNSGINYVVMEVSAHAIALKKIEGIKFEIGVLTNITQDHLDYFKTMENYANVKKSFFEPEFMKMGIVCGEDQYGRELMIYPHVPTICYGKGDEYDVNAKDIECSLKGSNFNCEFLDEKLNIESNLVGDYNVENLLAGIAVARSLGVDKDVVRQGIKKLAPVEGRFNVINLKDKNIIIDYAHTPDGLEKVLKTAKKLSKNKLVCLFGCGGNRDRKKRPIMGNIACKCADDVVITSDNPRFEDPYVIMEEISKGLTKPCKEICDRREAINYAIKKYKNNETIVIAGKGAENYQEIKGKKYPFSDFQVVYESYKSNLKPFKKNKSYPFDEEKY